MRVVSGSARGRKLKPVPGDSTRPILDRVKTALFDIIRPRLPEIQMLDLFAGSGAVGIEALSQGAAHCTFLDLNEKAARTIRENLESTGFSAQGEVRHTDAFRYLRHTTTKSFDLIYIAPPQYETLWTQALQTIGEHPELVRSGGMLIAQIDPTEDEAINMTAFEETEQRKDGNTLLVFYSKR